MCIDCLEDPCVCPMPKQRTGFLDTSKPPPADQLRLEVQLLRALYEDPRFSADLKARDLLLVLVDETETVPMQHTVMALREVELTTDQAAMRAARILVQSVGTLITSNPQLADQIMVEAVRHIAMPARKARAPDPRPTDPPPNPIERMVVDRLSAAQHLHDSDCSARYGGACDGRSCLAIVKGPL